MAAAERGEFGTAFKRLRLAAGLTHEALAERASVSARTISDLERGVAQAPRRETLALLAEALALTPGQRGMLERAAGAGMLRARRAGGRHNLPPQFTSFVGRGSELQAIRALMQQPDTRLVTLLGAGGTGKTRLAFRVAEELLPVFPDGVFVVPLASVSEAGDLAQAIAQALGVTPTDGGTPEAALVDLLRYRQVLLLLDNMEHLVGGAPLLTRLLAACVRLTILTTSRAPLRLSAEQEFPVLPLPVPDLRRLPPEDALLEYPAIALFVERATRVRPEFRLSAANAAAIAAICARLDGLPLALELAAARIKLLSPRTLLARLESPGGSALALLNGGARDLPRRHQTLRDTIAWSYDLLSADEQRLFRRLAIFAGGSSLEAAEAVCTDLADHVLVDLASLVDKTLLYRAEDVDDEPRFGMLETIRELALEQLAASGELALIRERHTRYFLAMVESSGAVLLGGAHRPLRLAAERDNIRAALRALVASG